MLRFFTLTLSVLCSLSSLVAHAEQATEEAIINAMTAAPTMVGIDGFRVQSLPHQKVRSLFDETVPNSHP